MNFFQSLLSDDSDPHKLGKPDHDSSNGSRRDDPNADGVVQDDNAAVWSFGGLIKNITTRSESVMEAYRRDLGEFGSGLRKETEILREVASRAVKDLPTSLEAGASAAQGALDGMLKSTAEIMDTMVSDGEPDTPEMNRSLYSGRYSWFGSQLSAIQGDLSTFCEEPEDVEEYEKWRSGFDLKDKRDEIEGLIGENGILEGVYKRVVPNAVNREAFWCRYFYRVERLKQQEMVRSNLVKRAIPVDDDDELSWDVDDDEDDGNVNTRGRTSGVKVEGGDAVGDKRATDRSSNPVEKQDGLICKSQDEKEGGNSKGDANRMIESDKKSVENVSLGEKEVKAEEVAVVKSAEKVKPEEIAKEQNDAKVNDEIKGEEIEKEKKDIKVKSEETVKEENGVLVKSEEIPKEKNDDKVSEKINGESFAKSDAAVVSTNQSKVEDEDLEWDEIEDIGSGDEKKISGTTSGGSANRVDLRKRLNAAEDDEDLSWDIEDDDEPGKA